jgi:hypothetical protein
VTLPDLEVAFALTSVQIENFVFVALQVFPKLQEWCEAHRFHLVTTDLQWGLENEIKTKERLEASLHEIERYREDGSCFFFLALLSEMAGWIPTPSDMADVASRFGCIQGVSMQEIEIINAAYRDKSPNGILCSNCSGACLSERQPYLSFNICVGKS